VAITGVNLTTAGSLTVSTAAFIPPPNTSKCSGTGVQCSLNYGAYTSDMNVDGVSGSGYYWEKVVR
jgi:hypothetical protein